MELFLQSWQPFMADWFALTVANPAYAATIAGITWLLTAMLGAIRAKGLKKIIGQQQLALDDVNGQLQTTRQTLAISQADADQVRQAAQASHMLLVQRNNQVANIIQMLAMSFDLGEHPIPVTEDAHAEALWEPVSYTHLTLPTKRIV